MDKNLTDPYVSVVLPVYNCESYIGDAVRSILDQTYKYFELIVINDGSTDKTLKKLEKFNDGRLRIISRENKGLVESLNEGIGVSKGKYIARQDADDISEPTRLSEQVKMLESDESLVMVGSSIITIDSKGAQINTHHILIGRNVLRQELLVRSPFAHGSVMFRRDAFELSGGYQKAEWPAEDYGLWIRLAELGDLGNIDTPLYRYRENADGISATNRTEQAEKSNGVLAQAWSKPGRFIKPFHSIEKQVSNGANDRVFNNSIKILAIALRKKKYLTVLSHISVVLSSPILLRKFAGKIRSKL